MSLERGLFWEARTVVCDPTVGPGHVRTLVVSYKDMKHEEMRAYLHFTRERTRKYADEKRLKGPIFKEGDMVYLHRFALGKKTANIKTTRPSDKLDFKKLGPYPVKKVISEVNYELTLPDGIRIHPVFHISLLEKASRDELQNGPIMDSIEVLPVEEEYEVEEIRAIRMENNERQYLIKWKNYGEDHNAWEPTDHLSNQGEITLIVAPLTRADSLIRLLWVLIDGLRRRKPSIQRFPSGSSSPLA